MPNLQRQQCLLRWVDLLCEVSHTGPLHLLFSHPKKLQTPLQSVVQQEHHIQPPQPETAQQQPSVLTPNFPFQLNALQSQDQHQQLLQPQYMGMIPGANTSMHQAMQLGIGNSGFFGGERRRSRQDLFESGSGGSQGGNSASGRLSGERDSHL